jgi:exodeoxyribonuclease X
MQKIVFLDTETTGNTENDFLCQLAYKTETETFSGLYRPAKKIPPEASAVHHLTNKMVTGKPAFKETPEAQKIKALLEDPDTVMVAHNAPFDLMILEKENIEPKKFICTLRLVRYLDPEGKIERYNLQYLRYFLDLEVEALAHDALGDVLVLEKLYAELKKKLQNEENLDEEKVVKKMIEVSSHPSLLKYINFGKHNGKEIAEIARIDRGYLEWLLAQKLESDQIDEDWIYTLKHHLGKLF